VLPELNLQELLGRKRVHCSRNPRLMRTLVDLGLTRDQGEGIPRMFAEMEDAFLPAPRIEPTARNVSVVLGNTTTLTEADRSFVERLASEELSQEEFRALLQAHRHTQVDNASLRQLIGLYTLGASRVLGRLRDRSMLELHRAGAQSYYTLGQELLAGDRPDQGKLALDRGELAADRGGLLDAELQQVLASLGTRPRKEKLRQAIARLCSDQWRSVAWLASLLKFEPRNLSGRHLTPMLKDGLPLHPITSRCDGGNHGPTSGLSLCPAWSPPCAPSTFMTPKPSSPV
jgi:ATP-dependent DNA helicase RecG